MSDPAWMSALTFDMWCTKEKMLSDNQRSMGGEQMRIVDPGHSYELNTGNVLVFLQKAGGEIVRDGTTNEELLEVLIDRVAEAYQRLPCAESIRALHLLEEALAAFKMRTARRVDANVEGTYQRHGHGPEAVDASGNPPGAVEVDQIYYLS